MQKILVFSPLPAKVRWYSKSIGHFTTVHKFSFILEP